MIVDSSAIVAIVLAEPGCDELIAKLGMTDHTGSGAPTLAETAIVLSARLGRDARTLLARLLDEASIDVVPFGEAHYRAAVDAWWKFGKGRHEASLNFGDCMSYATARLAHQPLLCTGEDFRRTDLQLA